MNSQDLENDKAVMRQMADIADRAAASMREIVDLPEHMPETLLATLVFTCLEPAPGMEGLHLVIKRRPCVHWATDIQEANPEVWGTLRDQRTRLAVAQLVDAINAGIEHEESIDEIFISLATRLPFMLGTDHSYTIEIPIDNGALGRPQYTVVPPGDDANRQGNDPLQ